MQFLWHFLENGNKSGPIDSLIRHKSKHKSIAHKILHMDLALFFRN